MNTNKRIREKMIEKGPAAAKKWEKERQENAHNFNPSAYEKAKDEVRSYYRNQEV